MKITKQWLEKHSACSDGVEWFLGCGETEHDKVIKKLIKEKHPQWANWAIVRIMNHNQRIQYAIYAASNAASNAAAYASNAAAYAADAAANAAAYAAANAAMLVKIIKYGLRILREK